MTKLHKDASPGIAQAILDGLPPDARAAVEKEAKEKGVAPLDIVRASIDIMIRESGRAR